MKKKLNIFIALIIINVISINIVFAECTSKQHSPYADFGKTAMPIASIGVSLLHKDYIGVVGSAIITYGVYPLNNYVEKKINAKRPCGCMGSFPSGHMIMMAGASSHLYHRYGWEYGLPAYAISFALAHDRVKCKAHYWSDLIGTAAIMHVAGYLFIKKFEFPSNNMQLAFMPNYVSMRINF